MERRAIVSRPEQEEAETLITCLKIGEYWEAC
jgi:hypothetical protein